MARERVLLIEDDADIQELVRFNLDREGYRVTVVDDGEAALKAVEKRMPDLVILDLMLPGIDGLSVCRELRARDATKSLPIMMLTAKSEEADVVAGLEVGADDYIVKPFSPRILLARVRALLRRGEVEEDGEDIVRRDVLLIDRRRHEVKMAGKPVDLTLTEFRVLELLARRPGIVFSRFQIVDAVKGEDYPVTDRSVDVQIVGLRRKLGRFSSLIETVRGVGYRFKAASH